MQEIIGAHVWQRVTHAISESLNRLEQHRDVVETELDCEYLAAIEVPIMEVLFCVREQVRFFTVARECLVEGETQVDRWRAEMIPVFCRDRLLLGIPLLLRRRRLRARIAEATSTMNACQEELGGLAAIGAALRERLETLGKRIQQLIEKEALKAKEAKRNRLAESESEWDKEAIHSSPQWAHWAKYVAKKLAPAAALLLLKLAIGVPPSPSDFADLV